MQTNVENASIPEQGCVLIESCLSAMNDEVLVSAASLGDSGAFAELYERHSKKVLPRIYRITKNREDAEDAFQDAVLRAFVHIKNFEGRSTFTSWLTRIAMNSALMVLRRRKGGREISLQQICDDSDNTRAWEPQDHADSPEACYARHESEEFLRKAIQRLPYVFRETVELQQTEECSIGEVASKLGISEPAAKSRLMRARKVLQRRLSGTRPRTLRAPVPVRGVSLSRKSLRAHNLPVTGLLGVMRSEGGRAQ